jgi:hypothetical protein
MKTKTLLPLAIFVACALFLVWHWVFRKDPRTAPRRDMADDAAAFLVKEAAALAPAPVSLLVLVPTNAAGGDPFPVQLAWRVRQLAAAQKDAFSAVADATVPENGLMELDGECVKKEPFLAALAAHPEATVVLSLVGVPRLDAADWSGVKRPKLAAFTTARVQYLEQLAPGTVALVVQPKPDMKDTSVEAALGQAGSFYQIRRFP